MGVAIYPVFSDGSGGWIDGLEGKSIARALETLERAARYRGVQPLYTFFSYTTDDAVAEGLVDDPKDFTEQWFDSGEGLRTVRALLTYVRDSPGRIEHVERVVGDLEVFERLLADAVARNLKWHLGQSV